MTRSARRRGFPSVWHDAIVVSLLGMRREPIRKTGHGARTTGNASLVKRRHLLESRLPIMRRRSGMRDNSRVASYRRVTSWSETRGELIGEMRARWSLVRVRVTIPLNRGAVVERSLQRVFSRAS